MTKWGFRLGVFLAVLAVWAGVHAEDAVGVKKINHIFIIYEENWSFDGLYGNFKGANGIANAGDAVKQKKLDGTLMDTLPTPYTDTYKKVVDTRFPNPLPVAPYDLSQYVKRNEKTGDLLHEFYTEQKQIDGGKMDLFAAYSDNGGLVMSYFDASDLPVGKLAKQYTLCDNYFHGAFGGSFLNHMFLIAAAPPTWPKAPPAYRITFKSNGLYNGGCVTPENVGDYVVDTAFSVNFPNPVNGGKIIPPQNFSTIGDRLNDKKIKWAWYSGGFDNALKGHPDEEFQFHHQPFMYFSKYAKSNPPNTLTDLGKTCLKDEDEFYKDLKNMDEKDFPKVCWIKNIGADNEHPGYASVVDGQNQVDELVKRIQESKYWNDCVIIITYDEHGGRWDHVAPPTTRQWDGKTDWMGPGTRVPLIIVSPFAKKQNIDSTPYDTMSLLKFIENRWDLKPLNERDKNATNILNAFDFNQAN